jgi:enolase-phosphatase E1
MKKPAYILMDIEGTTSSINFVMDELFPYFRKNLHKLEQKQDNPEVKEAYKQVDDILRKEEGRKLESFEDFMETLHEWSVADKKITPLKAIQGLIWKEGYHSKELKGHVYIDVQPALSDWKEQGIELGVFSSGSIAAQKLIFGFSQSGDLTSYFTHHFDTTTGGKREPETYTHIAENIGLSPSSILFLSDIQDELDAAELAGFQTIQLLREDKELSWHRGVQNFTDIVFLK